MQSKIGFKMVKLAAYLLAASLTAVVAVPKNPKIVGGSLTTISQYPFAASLLYSYDLVNYYQSCGGTILTTKSVLSAGHCFYGDTANRWRIRVGSSWANTGGSVYNVSSIVIHPNFDYNNLNNDVAILRTANINYVTGSVQAASIAGANYILADSQPVYAIGWGTTYVGGTGSEQLRHVQIWTVNQSVCQSRYFEIGWTVTTGMVCSGWLDVGGRDQCQGDSGGPLLHNNVVVGICSWGNQCALPRYPGVNTRVSNYTTWILANA